MPPYLRPATIEDVPLILRFITELAEYERMLDQVVATEEMLQHALLGQGPQPRSSFVLKVKNRQGLHCSSIIFPRFGANPAFTSKTSS